MSRDPVADVGDDRRRGREALAVEAEADHAGVVEDHRHLLGDRPGRRGSRCPTPSAGGQRHVADVEHAEQPVGDGLVGVGVGVVHADRRLGDGELVGVGLAAGDDLLGDRRHAVLVVGDVDAVPVDVGADRQLVRQLDLHTVADLDVDPRAGHHAVVRPRLDDLAGARPPSR